MSFKLKVSHILFGGIVKASAEEEQLHFHPMVMYVCVLSHSSVPLNFSDEWLSTGAPRDCIERSKTEAVSAIIFKTAGRLVMSRRAARPNGPTAELIAARSACLSTRLGSARLGCRRCHISSSFRLTCLGARAETKVAAAKELHFLTTDRRNGASETQGAANWNGLPLGEGASLKQSLSK